MPAGVPFVDTGNRLLTRVTADLETGTVSQADGTTLAVITVRTASTTLTVMLDAPSLATWMGVLNGLRGELGAGIQVVTPQQAQLMGLNGHRPARPDPG